MRSIDAWCAWWSRRSILVSAKMSMTLTFSPTGRFKDREMANKYCRFYLTRRPRVNRYKNSPSSKIIKYGNQVRGLHLQYLIRPWRENVHAARTEEIEAVMAEILQLEFCRLVSFESLQKCGVLVRSLQWKDVEKSAFSPSSLAVCCKRRITFSRDNKLISLIL